MAIREIVICSPLRTPVGRFGGVFADVPVADLASAVLAELLRRTGLDPAVVDDVVLGHAYPTSESPALGRVAALDAGLPSTVGGIQVDRRCGSGLQAVVQAAAQVATGASDVVLAGGAENMSRAPFYSHDMRWNTASKPALTLHDSLARGRVTAGGQSQPVPGGMIETAENLRREYGISRLRQDEYALLSQRRAAAAIEAGRFDAEIVPITTTQRRREVVVSADEHPRPDTDLDRLTELRPIMLREDPEATVTAGNSSGQNDGAAACVVTTPDRARELGLDPIVKLVGWAVAGVPAATMGIGPIPATAAVLGRAGLDLGDVDLIELNEAFAAQVLACLDVWGLKDDGLDRVNVNGSGISLGHPIGATGGRILATLAHEMRRRDARYGLETMCIGGGQGMAALFELV
jgi:acetyl-CoA C-acetyltransferase